MKHKKLLKSLDSSERNRVWRIQVSVGYTDTVSGIRQRIRIQKSLKTDTDTDTKKFKNGCGYGYKKIEKRIRIRIRKSQKTDTDTDTKIFVLSTITLTVNFSTKPKNWKKCIHPSKQTWFDFPDFPIWYTICCLITTPSAEMYFHP